MSDDMILNITHIMCNEHMNDVITVFINLQKKKKQILSPYLNTEKKIFFRLKS